MFEVFKIHFYLFSKEPEIGSHMQFTVHGIVVMILKKENTVCQREE